MTPAYDLAQRFIVSLCLWREARGEIREAKQGVLHVLMNRAVKPKAPYAGCSDLLTNVLRRAQFSSFNHTDPNATALPNPADTAGWIAWVECCDAADSPSKIDPTNGANYYHSYPESRRDLWPDWATDANQTAKIGAFRFYRL